VTSTVERPKHRAESGHEPSGIILAIAVFLDALCIRLILLPVMLRLTGHSAWHQPRWLARVLPGVTFSH